jgi:hypothetical protein
MHLKNEQKNLNTNKTMALDLNKIKSRLENLKSTNAKNTSIWKPTGKHVIRIVPYVHNLENPFIELLFHYGVNNKTYLSPASFNRPDPIVEFANKLKKEGNKENWKRGRALEPKMRTYVPILVRGEEDQGVKFYGMGKTVYQEILSIIADPDYGDITDLKTGRDIAVEFKDAKTTATGFAETAIRVKPNQTLAFDPSDKEAMKRFKAQKNVLELYPELTYDELSKIMDAWLNAPEEVEPTTTESASTSDSSEPVVEEATTAVAESKSPVAASGKKAVSGAKEVADEFDALFSGVSK